MSYKDYFNIPIDSEKKDWDVDTLKEKVNPIYNNGNHDYYVSMQDVIEGINSSKHKLSGNNVWLPDEDGNLIPLPDWIGNGGPGGGVTPFKQYRLEMLTTQGNIIKDKNFSTTLKAVLYEDNEDVTAIKDSKYFKWARFSGATESDQIADAEWNLKWSKGAKEIPITNEDVNRNAQFQVQFVTDKQSDIWIEQAYKNYMKKINKQ